MIGEMKDNESELDRDDLRDEFDPIQPSYNVFSQTNNQISPFV